jgi:hypothetical protein
MVVMMKRPSKHHHHREQTNAKKRNDCSYLAYAGDGFLARWGERVRLTITHAFQNA